MFFTICYVIIVYGMARKRKNLVIDVDILKCAEKRMKEVNRKSLTNYIENLILEDCKNSKA